MTRRAVLALCLLAAPALAGPDAITFVAPAAIDLDAAPGLFRQCSRPAPAPDGAVWIPDSAEIAVLQQRLQVWLTGSDTAVTQALRRVPGQYQGQFVGFRQGDTRLIYAAFAPADPGAAQGPGTGRARIVCDGGHAFWGVVYDPATGGFSDFRTNGRP